MENIGASFGFLRLRLRLLFVSIHLLFAIHPSVGYLFFCPLFFSFCSVPALSLISERIPLSLSLSLTHTHANDHKTYLSKIPVSILFLLLLPFSVYHRREIKTPLISDIDRLDHPYGVMGRIIHRGWKTNQEYFI